MTTPLAAQAEMAGPGWGELFAQMAEAEQAALGTVSSLRRLRPRGAGDIRNDAGDLVVLPCSYPAAEVWLLYGGAQMWEREPWGGAPIRWRPEAALPMAKLVADQYGRPCHEVLLDAITIAAEALPLLQEHHQQEAAKLQAQQLRRR